MHCNCCSQCIGCRTLITSQDFVFIGNKGVYISVFLKRIPTLVQKCMNCWWYISKREYWPSFDLRNLLGCYFLCGTLMFLVASKPSNWLRSSSIVLCTSLSPPDPPSRREDPMESISSMKMIEGACSRAITKSSRTMRAPGGGEREKWVTAVTISDLKLIWIIERGAAHPLQ